MCEPGLTVPRGLHLRVRRWCVLCLCYVVLMCATKLLCYAAVLMCAGGKYCCGIGAPTACAVRCAPCAVQFHHCLCLVFTWQRQLCCLLLGVVGVDCAACYWCCCVGVDCAACCLLNVFTKLTVHCSQVFTCPRRLLRSIQQIRTRQPCSLTIGRSCLRRSASSTSSNWRLNQSR